MKGFLLAQRDSRERLRKSVATYVALRAALGSYEDVVRCKNRNGQDVVVLLRLDILPDERNS